MGRVESNDDVVVDLNVFCKKIKNKKNSLILSFLFFIILGLLVFMCLPKKYDSEAKILIKKSGSTNLSDINPFVLSDKTDLNSAIGFFTDKNSVSEEIEIIKSSLVMENVISENNLRYKKGPSKGELITTRDFLKGDILINKVKGADIIYISYKSDDPETSYSVVASIINNYKKAYEQINLTKAEQDTDFLEKTYLKAKKELSEKILKLKQNKENLNMISAIDTKNLNLTLMSLYDKRLRAELAKISDKELSLKSVESEIEYETQKIQALQKKLEWSLLVEQMAKNASHIVVLEKPYKSPYHDYSEPNLFVVLAVSIVLWGLAATYILINEGSSQGSEKFPELPLSDICIN